MEPRRPDDPLPRLPPARPAPRRRSIVVRLVVTIVTVGLIVDAWLWFDTIDGVAQGFAAVLAVLLTIGCALLLGWAWKKHPF